MKTIMTTAVAALLWAGTGSAQPAPPAASAPAHEPLRTRDQPHDAALDGGGETPDGLRDRERLHALDGTPDRIRSLAHDRMHEALVEHATLPTNAPELPAGAAARERDRDRHRDAAHEAEAVRAAERHLARSRAGEAARAHHERSGHVEPGTRMGSGDGSGECGEAAGQRHLMEMHGGSMHDGGGEMGGPDGDMGSRDGGHR